MDLDYLDTVVERVLAGDDSGVGVLSTGEHCYVALASSRVDLLPRGDSVAYAIGRLEPHELSHLVDRWCTVRRG